MLYLFYIFAFISVACAIGVVASRSPVNSVISLILCFLSIAGHYILLNAQFLAVVHIIVYTGAIMVLFLFVIMLLNLNKAIEPRKSLVGRVVAVAAAGIFLLTVLGAIKHGIQVAPGAEFNAGTGLVKSVGQSLFGPFLLPFEISSVLFLSAIIGAVMLGRKETGSKQTLQDGDGLAGSNQAEHTP